MKVVVTGTSRGIGYEVAKIFLENNHQVIGIDKNDATINHENYTHIKKDIRDKDLPDIEDVEILVNNAGVQLSKDDIDTNLKGTINVTEKYAYQKSIKSVLFMASAAASNGAEFPYYVASKGGVISYMKYTAKELAKYGATANSISAGGVITPLNDHIINNEELYEKVLNETMLNKWATSREIAEHTYFYTVVNKSMTGQDILIDNGELMKSNFIW